MQLIPAIDLINNTCVRLFQGDFNLKTTYNNYSPLEMAQQFESLGVTRLHLVDLDGAKNKKIKHLHILESIASKTNLKIDFGGGVQSQQDVQDILNAGATYVTIGSLCVQQKDKVLEWINHFGNGKFLLGVDRNKEGKVAINGWLHEIDITVESIIQFYFNNNFNHFFCTDIAVDGSFNGPSTAWYDSLIKKFKGIQLIASGGVHQLQDIESLNTIGCFGAIVGKAIYENKITHQEIKKYCHAL